MSLMDFVMLAGGFGLFLYGMSLMREGLELAAGDRLRKLLESMTSNRFLAVLAGAAIAAVVQSSSSTTVMVVGFVNAGLMTLAQAVGVIMGANIGTTITAQIIALNLTSVAPVVLFIGVCILLFSKPKSSRKSGPIIAGLGMLFLGITLMGQALAPLVASGAFSALLPTIQNPLFGILAGLLFTALIKSSAASVGLLQVFALQGLVGLDSVIFFLLGQNIGSCLTTMLDSVGTGVAARRTALIHLLFNIIGSAIFIVAVSLLPVVSWIAALAPRSAAAQIAAAHTLFNVVTTIILFPAAKGLVALCEKLVPGTEYAAEELSLRFLDDRILATPSIAVSQIVKEVDRMGSVARRNFSLAMQCFFTLDEKEFERLTKEVSANEKLINYLNREIVNYLIRINSLDLSEHDYHTVGNLFHTVSDIERIGDHAENILEYAQQKREEKLPFSEFALGELREMTARVEGIIDRAILMFHADVHDVKVFAAVMEAERGIDERTRELRSKHVERLTRGDCDAVSGMIFVDLLTNMERAADHAVNIAQAVNSPK